MNALLLRREQWHLRVAGRAEQVFARGPGPELPATLREALAALPGKGALTVQLAGALARWLLLPHSPRLSSEQAWAPFAHAWFEQQHAQAASAWTLRWLVETPGHPRLMAALPTALIAALREATQRRTLSVQLQTSERLARLRAQQPRFTGAFCDMDAEHCVLVLCHQGRPVRVRKRAGALDAQALAAMIKTEWAGCAAPSKTGEPADATLCTRLALAPASWPAEADLQQLQAHGLAHITRLNDEGPPS
jgi:hypothetical protein